MATALGGVGLPRRTRALAGVVCVSLLLGGCGSAVAPPVSAALEAQWIDNVRSLIGTLQSDVMLSTVGGANVATARRVMRNASDVTTLLVAYDLFGACGRSLADAGTPGPQATPLVATRIAACARLERASALFADAMTRHAAAPLLAAGRQVLAAVPLLARASSQLATLRRRGRG